MFLFAGGEKIARDCFVATLLATTNWWPAAKRSQDTSSIKGEEVRGTTDWNQIRIPLPWWKWIKGKGK